MHINQVSTNNNRAIVHKARFLNIQRNVPTAVKEEILMNHSIKEFIRKDNRPSLLEKLKDFFRGNEVLNVEYRKSDKSDELFFSLSRERMTSRDNTFVTSITTSDNETKTRAQRITITAQKVSEIEDFDSMLKPLKKASL